MGVVNTGLARRVRIPVPASTSSSRRSFSARAVPYVARRKPWFDGAMFVYCTLVALLLLAVLGMAVYTSFIKLWPYDK